uniref:Uncharacterized protein n=1 Tax=Streptomyces sp. NBC_00049 TaxID=2903617 RepID=A0AAU2JKP7_9ACTN
MTCANTASDLNAETGCQGGTAGNGRRCVWRFSYVDVVNPLNQYSVRIPPG